MPLLKWHIVKLMHSDLHTDVVENQQTTLRPFSTPISPTHN